MLQTGQEAVGLGCYQVERRDGKMHMGQAPPNGWEQEEIEREKETSPDG